MTDGLEVSSLAVRFGGLTAVDGQTLTTAGVVRPGYLLGRGEVVFADEPGELDADSLTEQYVRAGH